MEYVFVLEDEEIHQRAISKAVQTINPQLKTKFFKDLEEFYRWLKSAMATTGRILDPETEDSTPEKVRLFIAKSEFILPANLGILDKTKELLSHRGLSSPETPLGFVLTAFDEPDFKFEQYKKPILFNLIFKPFDEIILTQHLSAALEGFNRPTESTLTSQKTSATAEMLKLIEVKTVSDIGFISKSQKTYPVGGLSKYYSGLFAGGGSKSAFARLAQVSEVGERNLELDYRFFAAEIGQVASLRKVVRAKDKGKSTERDPQAGVAVAKPVFVIIEPRDNEFNILGGTIKRRFAGAQIFRFQTRKELEDDLGYASNSGKAALSADLTSVAFTKDYVLGKTEPADATLLGRPLLGFDLAMVIDKTSLDQLGLWKMGAGKEHLSVVRQGEQYSVIKFLKNGSAITIVNPTSEEKVAFLKTKRQLPAEVHYLIACADVDPHNLSGWEHLARVCATELSFSPVIQLIAGRSYTDEDKKKLAACFEDIFFTPLDRAYFLLKLIYGKYSMQVLEDKLSISEKALTEKVYAATGVHIDEISEAGIGFKYPDVIEKGSFREFVLDRPLDVNVPVLTGICYACEKIEGKEGGSNVYFVFFGVRDHELKFIRLWIRENYVHAKEKGS